MIEFILFVTSNKKRVNNIYKEEVRWPEECSDDQTDCDATITWAGVAEDVFSFTITANKLQTGQYIALGLI